MNLFEGTDLLLEATNFGPVDILIGLGATLVATQLAVSTPSYRLTKSQDTDTPYIHDARLWLGSLGLLSSEVFISNENISRPLRDLSFGILCSLYSTEVVRARALTRMKKENKKVAI